MPSIDFGTALVETGVSSVFAGHYPRGSMWKGNGDRDETVIITFNRTFQGEPVVHISISHLDCNQNHDIGYKLRVTDISSKNFAVKMSIWKDAKFNSLSINWMAIGKDT